MRFRLLFIPSLLFLAGVVLGQEQEWHTSPKLLNDTIEANILEVNNKLFVTDVYDQIISDDGFFWISTRGNGLQKISVENNTFFYKGKPEHSQYPSAVGHSIYERENNLFVGYGRGFCKYLNDLDSFQLYGQNDLAKLEPYKSSAHAMTWISKDTLLIGNKWGLLLFDLENDKIIKTLWEEEAKIDGASSYNFVKELIPDPLNKNLFWGVGRKGLFSIEKGSWEQNYIAYKDNITPGTVLDYMNDLIKIDDNIYILYCGNNRKWNSNGNEILKYNTKTGSWKQILNYTYYNKAVDQTNYSPVSTFQRYGDYILVCSRGFGPQLIDTKTDEVIQIYISHPDFRLASIWKNKERKIDFYLKDIYAASIDRNGYLWAIVRREKLVHSKEPILIPQSKSDLGSIKIHNIYVNGTKYTPSKYSKKGDPLSFFLNQRERDFALDFSLVNCPIDSIIYEYKLNNQEWKKPINNYLARFNQLKGGKHKLILRARKGEMLYDQQELSIIALKRLHEQSWFIICILSFLSLIGLLFYRTKIKGIRNEEKLKTTFQKQLAEIEMQALRAQMNPHFLFNSLNSIKHYAVNKSKSETAQYITTFSHLVRQILQNSNDKIISLAQELQALKLYIQVEQNRFDQKFDFEISIHEDLNPDTIFMPPLLLQPYLENAIWHGLMHKKNKGTLKLSIYQEHEVLNCLIEDDGIGRRAAASIKKNNQKFKKKSLGTKITTDRIKLIQKIYKVKTDVTTTDLYDDIGKAIGTKVIVKIPKILKETISSLRNLPS